MSWGRVRVEYVLANILGHRLMRISGRGSAVEEQNWLDDAAWMLDARTALRTTDWFDELSSTPRQTKIPADGSSSSCCQPQAVEEDAEEGAVEEGEGQTRELHLGVDVLHVLLQVYNYVYICADVC